MNLRERLNALVVNPRIHFTNKSSLKPSPGSTYYNLRKDDFIKVSDQL